MRPSLFRTRPGAQHSTARDVQSSTGWFTSRQLNQHGTAQRHHRHPRVRTSPLPLPRARESNITDVCLGGGAVDRYDTMYRLWAVWLGAVWPPSTWLHMAALENRAVTCAPEATEAAADGGLIYMAWVIP